MFENFRERLHMVQQDLTTGLEESLPQFTAGQDILSRYEESWFVLHKKTKDCGQAAEVVDGEVVMLSAHWERRRSALTQLQEQLQSLPAFVGELEAVTASIAHLEGDFEEMESRLVHLETLCCRCEQQTSKQQHGDQLEAYKKQKRRELEALEAELNCEHVHKVAQLERTRQKKLREQQKVYEEAFHQDLEQYRSTGHVHRQATEADVGVLDQMTVTNLSDQEALDDFLNSGDDMSTESSLTSGPDLQSDMDRAWSDKDSECVPEDERVSEDSDDHVVQSDEEDIQPDMTLVGLQDVDAAGGSADSDSTGDVPSS
ncbi:dysbindin-A-like isoform X2 [Dunckerocampus dactyliophorus]|uniref:dysbindin-A-like isoform X2 n=1 Tax=Dunckerocampus dactyliophorus TaxID=161453 RepID=UPI002405A400|nr:dysbindin-A-like isoform X2 [Dunckerocampus dactyliophorus]